MYHLEHACTRKSFLKALIKIFYRDAAALTEFWAWLEEEISRNAVLTEVEVADKLLEFRGKQAGFLETSFDTISGIASFVFLYASFM